MKIMQLNSKKAAVALSGGLDSSVTCFLLKNQGYDVAGITAKMVDDENFEQVVQNARKVAEKLEIPHYVLDLSVDFKKNIIDYFENSYITGKTPNPCIMCNKTIKWGKLFDFAMNKLGADIIATGHYARIERKNGVSKLFPAFDKKKDQLYYLFELSQEQLGRTIFPLCGLVKDDIRKIAAENDLPSKSSKESQDICFIKKPMTAKKYLLERFKAEKGDFVLKKSGKKLGMHDGFFQYTIGQRKGVGIAYSEPLYVTGIDAKNNIVYLGTKDELLTDTIIAKNFKTQYPTDKKSFDVLAKIRYNMDFKPAHVEIAEETAQITFKEPVSAVTPGQAAVLYDPNDGHLIGGGWIE